MPAARPGPPPTPACLVLPWCALQGPGKKWEHLELNSNGKPERVSMHVRKGDTVKVRARERSAH